MSLPLATLLDAVTATGAGGAKKYTSIPENFTIQLSYTGSPTSVVVDIEGSIDGNSYVQIAQHTATATPDMFHISGKPVKWIRANLTTLTGGTSPTVTVLLQANEGNTG